MIMLLRSKNNPEAPIFHSVNQSWDKKGYVFQYILPHEDEARVIILRLILILCHKFRDQVIKNFTPDAVEQMKLATYDKKIGEVASLMDTYIVEVENVDIELNLKKRGQRKK